MYCSVLVPGCLLRATVRCSKATAAHGAKYSTQAASLSRFIRMAAFLLSFEPFSPEWWDEVSVYINSCIGHCFPRAMAEEERLHMTTTPLSETLPETSCCLCCFAHARKEQLTRRSGAEFVAPCSRSRAFLGNGCIHPKRSILCARLSRPQSSPTHDNVLCRT
jgi:hypothetical protein